MRRFDVLLAIALVLVLLLGYFLWKGRQAPPGDDRKASIPGLVILCMDTLRFDGPAAPGSKGEGPMPRLDAFARDATVFADGSASAPWTPPSIATLLTGLYPSHHGVHGVFDAPPLVQSVTTLAEALHDAGWTTVAFTAGGWLDPVQGVAQGFDGFGTGFDAMGPEATIATWDRKREKGRPFFLFLHTLAPHDPYGWRGPLAAAGSHPPRPGSLTPAALEEGLARGGGKLPPDMRTAFMLTHLTDPAASKALADGLGVQKFEGLWNTPEMFAWIVGGYAGTPDRARIETEARDAYREGLSFADEVFARTWGSLQGLGLPEGTVFVVVSDHGEAFGEHRSLYHGLRLYDELLRVPMIVRAPGRLPQGRVVRGSAGVVDLMPTVLRLAHVPVPEGLDGRSLLPLVRGEQTGHPIVAEVERPASEVLDGVATRCVSVRTERAKWILTYEQAGGRIVREEVYDLVADPSEQSPLTAFDARTYGDEFCRAVQRARNEVRKVAGEAPVEAGCGPAK